MEDEEVCWYPTSNWSKWTHGQMLVCACTILYTHMKNFKYHNKV